ncbi:redox-regulated ATPase YchF [bacterium]|nr:redox-regulated ATPase YchF [bacterium]
MQIALIGFSKSGKTTIFNALTGQHAEVSAFAVGKGQTHRAVVEVPDERVEILANQFESKKIVHAAIDYLDPVGIRRDQAGQGEGLGDEMLHTIANSDALVAVVRDFEDESGVDRDPEGDFETIVLELILSDLKKVDSRLDRIESQVQRIGGADKLRLQHEVNVLRRLKEALESERPIRNLVFDSEETRVLRSFQFLTSKSLLVVINTGEGDSSTDLQNRLREQAVQKMGEVAAPHFITLSGQTEMEIAQLDPEERDAFLEEYGITEPGASRMIQLSYEALGLMSFLTVGPTEAHAWTIPIGTRAVEAAGAIHSDLERGFIRAQAINYKDLLEAKTFPEAKKRGVLRLEGKEYIVQDGDVIEIMFSV